MHKATERFWKCYRELNQSTREVADKNFHLLRENPRHPSLQFKKVGKLWSVRVGLAYRALAAEDGEDFIWVWIGSHEEYEEMIQRP